MKRFDWVDTIERGLWTGIQAPAAAGIIDGFTTSVSVPALSYLWIALAGVGVSVVKTVAQDRLTFLETRKYKNPVLLGDADV